MPKPGKEQLVELYVNQGKSLAQTAKVLERSATYVGQLMRSYGIPVRNISEGIRVAGDSSGRWKKRIECRGYIALYIPDHPMASRLGYILEHRLRMAEHLGRILEPWEDVHHKDGDKQNNDINNLELLLHSEHTRVTRRDAKRRNNGCEWVGCAASARAFGFCGMHYRRDYKERKRLGRINKNYSRPGPRARKPVSG